MHRLPDLVQKEFNEARLILIRLIEIHQPQGSSNNEVTVVFDGQPGIWNWSEASVKVVFTLSESADDYIKRYVAGSQAKRSIVVVTDDRDIKYFVRAQGAKVLSVDEFLGKIKNSSRRPGRPAKSGSVEGKSISETLKAKITTEFERIWLKDR